VVGQWGDRVGTVRGLWGVELGFNPDATLVQPNGTLMEPPCHPNATPMACGSHPKAIGMPYQSHRHGFPYKILREFEFGES